MTGLLLKSAWSCSGMALNPWEPQAPPSPPSLFSNAQASPLASASSSTETTDSRFYASQTQRRHLNGPLHASHRTHPTWAQSCQAPSADAIEGAQEPSVFLPASALSSSRKRSHHSALSSPAIAPASGRSYGALASHPSRRGDNGFSLSRSPPNVRDFPDLGGDEVWMRSRPRPPSPASRFHSLTSDRRSGADMSQPQTSYLHRPPQGEFSFQAQGPSTHATYEHGAGDDTNGGPSGEREVESSSAAFARLARAQRRQQERQRFAQASAIESDAGAEEPPSKRRRGVTGALVDGALNAALYTGAAALTAYSLWSSWGRKGKDEDEGYDEEHAHHLSARERLPPGALEEPPPPYLANDVSRFAHGSAAGTCTPKARATNTPTVSRSSRPVHVFISSRRRRPVFASHRSARGTPMSSQSLRHGPSRNGQDTPAALDSPTPTTKPLPEALGGEEDNHVKSNDNDDEDEDAFSRFQARMSELIAEGQAALVSKPEVDEMEFVDDEAGQASLQSHLPTAHAPLPATPSTRVPTATSSLHDGLHRGVRSAAEQGNGASTSSAFGSRLPTSASFTFGQDGTPSQAAAAAAAAAGSDAPQPSSAFSSTTRATLGSRSPSSPYSRLPRAVPSRSALATANANAVSERAAQSSPPTRRRF